jgi:LacI family transcriptional regulator
LGFDDLTLGDMVEPGITVISQDPYALGARAAELLFARLNGFDGESQLIVLPTELIRRGSGEITPAAPTGTGTSGS